MSFGIAQLNNIISVLNKNNKFDFFIEEYHHRMKKDSPSGTALFLKESLEKKLKKKIPDIISVRAGGIYGVHKIHMVSDSEHLIFEHQAMNRKIFAEGAIQAAEWLTNQNSGLYVMQDVLDE